MWRKTVYMKILTKHFPDMDRLELGKIANELIDSAYYKDKKGRIK